MMTRAKKLGHEHEKESRQICLHKWKQNLTDQQV
jgi:hypothetical protein